MNIVYSWLKEYVDIEDLSLEQLARILTMSGLEVEEIHLVGLPKPGEEKLENVYTGLHWEPDKIVVGQVNEVLPHPNADRLVLCRLQDGQGEYTVMTGASNLFEFKGKGPLSEPLKVAYAHEDAQIFDGHQPGKVLTTLKRMKIRGVESFSMICSEKELGISEEHEGVILLDSDAPLGMPLVDYMGDAVFEVAILPNMIRTACMLGAAREVAAALNRKVKDPKAALKGSGASIAGQVAIKINDPNLNPRFVFGLVRDTAAKNSPYWVQRRLRLAGMRPINTIVDATNYVMLEIGEPLHAFDYDILKERSGGKAPTIITRAAKQGEKLTTLDEVERTLDDFTILVTDAAGPLALAGVMGGMESEVMENTRNVLLEGATWNFINTRRTSAAQHLQSEAAYRFARNLHPALAKRGVSLCISRIAEWGGGEIAAGLVDAYPNPLKDTVNTISPQDVMRSLGITLTKEEIASLLERLEFRCSLEKNCVRIQTPPHRMDIGEGVVGKADLMEEIARVYGYEQFPSTRLADQLPPQRNYPLQERERSLRDVLTNLGLQEVVNYRLTNPQEEMRLYPLDEKPKEPAYIQLQNPISQEKRVMRRSLLASVLQIIEKNIRLRERLALFEIGPIFEPQKKKLLPDESTHLAIALSGVRAYADWEQTTVHYLDFFDLKGILEAILHAFHIEDYAFTAAEQMPFHPGKCAALHVAGEQIGVLGELHPKVKENYDFGNADVVAADLNLDVLFGHIPEEFHLIKVPVYPPVIEDLAVIAAEQTSAAEILQVMQSAGQPLVSEISIFDIFRGKQIDAGKKSLAFRITYQAQDRTLTDEEVGKVREKIMGAVEQQLGAKVRSAE